ncbi:MAG: hypothetical protein Q8S20_13455 [Sulfuritalea sp.]|nr:hypothetical protein [Sulfuritalea sp.]
MSLTEVSSYFCGGSYAPLLFSLAILVVSLVMRGNRAGRTDAATQENDPAVVPVDGPHPGIGPTEYADVAEQQDALERLCRLPQVRRLSDNTVIDWGSGAELTPCDCSRPPLPHLMVSWRKHRTIGLLTKSGLAHYVAYQERVADTLLALLAVRVSRSGSAADTVEFAEAGVSPTSEPNNGNPDISPAPKEAH